ncbi:hypothetical protein AN393_03927 [Pseudoalteromonas sp. P1-25]|nr:hypothetical protein AN393_03927 [Pseudoalteromonas sp. P1-25]
MGMYYVCLFSDSQNTIHKEALRFREENAEYYFPSDVKNHHIAVKAFSYLEPCDVVVPTAVESHIANATLSLVGAALCGARLRAVLFCY